MGKPNRNSRIQSPILHHAQGTRVACIEWKLFFRSVMGYSNNDILSIEMERAGHDTASTSIHNPKINGLKYLSDYTLEEAQYMLNSETWTRAVFVREPKERVLSAYLDKYIRKPDFFNRTCCRKLKERDEQAYCRNKLIEEGGDFRYFLKHASHDCKNHHWDPQAENIDLKWWDAITFVGYFDSLAPDAQVLLSSIYSNSSSVSLPSPSPSLGESAWELYGKTGWGPNGTSAFLVRDSTIHVTNAHDKLRKYYTPRDEETVEQHWAMEWEQKMFHFDTFHLFEKP